MLAAMSSFAVLAAFCHLFFHSALALPMAEAAAAASSHTATVSLNRLLSFAIYCFG